MERLAALRHGMRSAGLDALVLVPGPNLLYYGVPALHFSERLTLLLLPVDGTPAFVLPALESAKANEAAFEAETWTWGDHEGPTAALKNAVAATAIAGGRVGVEGRRIRYLELAALSEAAPSVSVVPADELLAQQRMRKTDDELECMARAAQIAQTAFEAVLPLLGGRATERTVAAELEIALLRAGAEGLPFKPVVAAGPNGANPHAVPGEAVLEPGMVVTVDWGAIWSGYASDITRCVVVGGADPEPALIGAFEAVLEANRAGRAAVRPGAACEDIDGAARSAIEAAGFGDRFVHRTGHGLGLEVHEEPDIAAGNNMPLEPGMTFTIEPGIYLPGIGGVRIEDDMVVTESGGRSFTSLSRQLHVV